MSQLYASSAVLVALFIPVAVQFAPLCNLMLQQVQGVFVLDSRLHLVVDDNLYSFPFTADYINSKMAMVALFSQSTSADQPLEPHHWTMEENLAVVVKRLGGKYRSRAYRLLALNRFQSVNKTSGRCQFAHLILENSSHRQVHFLVNQTARRILEAESSQLDGRYALIGDGKHREYVIRSAGRDTTVFVPGPVVASGRNSPQLTILPNKTASISLNETFYGTVIGGNQVFFSSSPLAGTALVTDPANTFGFIFNDTVHIWNFASRQVYLFIHPSEGELSKLGNKGAPLRIEPMSTYFICSHSAWNIKVQSELKKLEDSNSTGTQPADLTTLDDGFKWWWLVGLLTGLPVLIAVAIGVCIAYRLRRSSIRSKGRRRTKRMSQSTNRQLSSHAFGALTSGLSDSPRSSDMDLTQLKYTRAPSSSLGSDNGTRKNFFVAKLPYSKTTNVATKVPSSLKSAPSGKMAKKKADTSPEPMPTMSTMLANDAKQKATQSSSAAQKTASCKSSTRASLEKTTVSDMLTTSAFPGATKATASGPTLDTMKMTDRGSAPGSQSQVL